MCKVIELPQLGIGGNDVPLENVTNTNGIHGLTRPLARKSYHLALCAEASVYILQVL
jgi:hypothetical protein